MTTLTPADRQRLAASVKRVEEWARDLFHAGPHWDEPAFPAHAAGLLEQAARLCLAEQWHLLNLRQGGE